MPVIPNIERLREFTNYLDQNQGDNLRREMRLMQLWGDSLLQSQASKPLYTFTADAAGVVVDGTTLTLASLDLGGSATTEDVTLYKDDILIFSASSADGTIANTELVIVADTVDIPAGGSAAAITITPQITAVSADATATGKCLRPFYSLANSPVPQLTATEAQALNAGASFYRARSTVAIDGSINLAGPALFNDPFFQILVETHRQGTKFDIETRFDASAVYPDGSLSLGTGPGTYQFRANLANFTPGTEGRDGFQDIGGALNNSGSINPYLPSGLTKSQFTGAANTFIAL